MPRLTYHFTRILCGLTLAAVLSACASASAGTSPTASPTPLAYQATLTAVPSLKPAASPTPRTKPSATSALPASPAAELPDTELPKTETASPGAASSPLPSPLPPFNESTWTELPVIPTLSPRALEILQAGLARGRSAQAFSKIGDCESQTDWFLDHYDLGPEHYSLGPYADTLQPVVDYYQGSFDRASLAARQGFTAASLMAPIWADRQQCQKDETPLACEIRVHNPLVAFILVGTNDATNPDTFEKHMRRAVEYAISQDVLPILGTKADNVEGDHQINATMARLAHEYQIPLWNYWAAVQDLPGNGLQEDGAHLTFAGPFFDNPNALKKAWPVRNLNALQVLSVVMDEVQ